jgi:cell division protein FtsW
MYHRLLWIILILVAFGLIVLSSAGVVDGQKKFDSPYYYVKHQLLFGVLPGLFLMFLLSKINYKLFKRLSFPILFVALVLLIMVFVPGLGRTLHGAQSWINIAGYTFQPAELLKIALVIYFAAWFGAKDERIKNFTYGTVPFLFIIGFAGILLVLQPDLGTLAVVALIATGVYVVAGAKVKHILIVSLICAIAFGGFIAAAPYRINRIKAFLNPSVDVRGISYQLNQSLIAIGSGGIFGVGFGHSRQKFGFLPETVGDSIFAVVSEELGLVGSIGTVVLFLALFWTLIRIAKNTSDKFGRLVVLGMTLWIAAQSFINIAAVTGIGPVTGIPLPFISYGGTALLSILAGFGIVLNIAKDK